MSKDWTGNSNTAWAILGASNHSDIERQNDDYYATHPIAMVKLLERESFSQKCWEPAVGGGHLAQILRDNGHDVRCTDIVDRGYEGTEILDFLDCTETMNNRDIITNPPYKFAQEFVQKALDISVKGTKVAMFLKVQFLEGKSRYLLFQENPPKHVYIFSSRVTCAMNGDFQKYNASALAYAWFVWEKGYKGETTLRWIADIDGDIDWATQKQVEMANKKRQLW